MVILPVKGRQGTERQLMPSRFQIKQNVFYVIENTEIVYIYSSVKSRYTNDSE